MALPQYPHYVVVGEGPNETGTFLEIRINDGAGGHLAAITSEEALIQDIADLLSSATTQYAVKYTVTEDNVL